jgi:hypothetical protein
MKKADSVLCKQILDWLNSRKHTFFFKTHGSGFLQAGVPDLVGCIYGHFVAFEVKMPGKEKTVTKLQKYYLDRFFESFGWVIVVTSLDEVKKYLGGRLPDNILDAIN